MLWQVQFLLVFWLTYLVGHTWYWFFHSIFNYQQTLIKHLNICTLKKSYFDKYPSNLQMFLSWCCTIWKQWKYCCILPCNIWLQSFSDHVYNCSSALSIQRPTHLDLMMQAKSKPLLNFIFVRSNIPKLLFKCFLDLIHVCVWKHMFVL